MLRLIDIYKLSHWHYLTVTQMDPHTSHSSHVTETQTFSWVLHTHIPILFLTHSFTQTQTFTFWFTNLPLTPLSSISAFQSFSLFLTEAFLFSTKSEGNTHPPFLLLYQTFLHLFLFPSSSYWIIQACKHKFTWKHSLPSSSIYPSTTLPFLLLPPFSHSSSSSLSLPPSQISSFLCCWESELKQHFR